MKSKLPNHALSTNVQSSCCKLCGCADPLGPLPEHLSYKEMRTIAERFRLVAKEIANNIFSAPSSVAWVLTSRFEHGSTFDKVEKYLLSVIRQSTQPDSSTQCKSPDKLSAPK